MTDNVNRDYLKELLSKLSRAELERVAFFGIDVYDGERGDCILQYNNPEMHAEVEKLIQGVL